MLHVPYHADDLTRLVERLERNDHVLADSVLAGKQPAREHLVNDDDRRRGQGVLLGDEAPSDPPSDRLQHLTDGVDQRIEGVRLAVELSPAFGGEAVEARLAVIRGGPPVGRDPTPLFQALERITFGLFAFALLGRPSAGVRPDLLAAIQQHRCILDGLRTRDPGIARETFVRVTLQFWKEQHCVEIGPVVTPSYSF